MALPQKHTVTANVQVRGGAARVVALENAVRFSANSDRTSADVIDVARTFEDYLNGPDDETDAANDDE